MIRRKSFWGLCLCLLFIPLGAFPEGKSYDRVLEELDQAIAGKAAFRAERERTIAQLKQRLANGKDDAEKFELCGELFEQYLHYQADSALHYVEEKARYAASLHRPELDAELAINRADVLGVMGAYNEALAEIGRIDRAQLPPDRLLAYYYALRTYYGWMADFTVVSERQKYLDKMACYRDSILALVPAGADRNIALAEKMIFESRTDEAIPLLNETLPASITMQQKAYVNYTLASAYEAKGETDMQIYYLARTALLDVSMSVREYASLQKLARLVYEGGSLDRAYHYLNCSMEDAVACNARLRFFEVTEFYPIIDRAYAEKEMQEKRMGWILFISVSVLAVLLIVLAGYLYYGMKKLSSMRRELSSANEALRVANEGLAQTGRIKEVYIARYLDRCVSYLNKLEQYRRSLEKLAMASRIDDLFKAIRSEQFLRDERKNFYNEFDRSFLELFPDFIADFNGLLADDGKIFPKSGELLNTELRIFALIRLGVTDANHIARFLGYSLATVYNYRSKIRNKAKTDKENFEQEVMKL